MDEDGAAYGELDEATLYAEFMLGLGTANPALEKALRDCDGLGIVLFGILSEEGRGGLTTAYHGIDPLGAAESAAKGEPMGLAALADAFADVSHGRHWVGYTSPGKRERMVAAAGVQRVQAEEALATALVAEQGRFAEAAGRIPGLESIGDALLPRLQRSVFERFGPLFSGPAEAMERVADGHPRATMVVQHVLESAASAGFPREDPLSPGRKEARAEAREIVGRGVRWPALERFAEEAARIPGLGSLDTQLRDCLYGAVYGRLAFPCDPSAAMGAAASGDPESISAVKSALESLAGGESDGFQGWRPVGVADAWGVDRKAQAVLEGGVEWPGPQPQASAGRGAGD